MNLSNLSTHLENIHCFNFLKTNIPILEDSRNSNNPADSVITIFSNFISHSTRPLNILEDQAFKKLISDLNPSIDIPSPYLVSKNIFKSKEKNQNSLKLILELSECVSLCFDIWSFNNKPYIATYISGVVNNLSYFNVFLSIREIESQHSINIQKHILEIIREFKIKTSIILSLTTDNCSSMIRANQDLIEILGDEHSVDISDNTIEANIQINQTFRQANIVSSVKNVLFSSSKILHLGCIIHKLQLSLKKTFSEVDWAQLIIEKIVRIVKITKKYKYNLKCPIPIQIRWNSIYITIDYFYKRIKEYRIFINSENTNEQFFNDEEIKKISFIKSILENFIKLQK